MKLLAVVSVFLSLMSQKAIAENRSLTSIIEKPKSHVWDRDDLFRNDPEILAEISKTLIDLKKEREMEVYLVTHSSLIGEKFDLFSKRCHGAWMGEESDGLVIVLVMNDRMGAEIGRSSKLYEGQFIEKGLLPRISFLNLRTIIQQSINEIQNVESDIDRVGAFVHFFDENVRERLSITKEADKSRESYHFMVWMALALLACGAVFGLLSMMVARVDRRSNVVFRFPDFIVPQRLKARYGGGKISVVDF